MYACQPVDFCCHLLTPPNQGGYLATNIATQNLLPGWLSSTKPDVVIMHLSTQTPHIVAAVAHKFLIGYERRMEQPVSSHNYDRLQQVGGSNANFKVHNEDSRSQDHPHEPFWMQRVWATRH